MTRSAERNLAGDRRPPSRGDQQRGLIIDAVTELLETVPIADLSVMAIAKHAGVTRPAFYFYFDSKYTAVAAALQQIWADIEAATIALDAYEFQESPIAFSDRMIDNAADVWRQHSALLSACVQSSDPQLMQMWDEFVGNLTARLTAFAERLYADGAIRPISNDIPALVDVLAGTTIWALVEEARRPLPGLTDRRLAAVREVWFATIWGVEQEPK